MQIEISQSLTSQKSDGFFNFWAKIFNALKIPFPLKMDMEIESKAVYRQQLGNKYTQY